MLEKFRELFSSTEVITPATIHNQVMNLVTLGHGVENGYSIQKTQQGDYNVETVYDANQQPVATYNEPIIGTVKTFYKYVLFNNGYQNNATVIVQENKASLQVTMREINIVNKPWKSLTKEQRVAATKMFGVKN